MLQSHNKILYIVETKHKTVSDKRPDQTRLDFERNQWKFGLNYTYETLRQVHTYKHKQKCS